MNSLIDLFKPTESIDRILILIFFILFMLNVGQAPVGKEEYVVWVFCSLMPIVMFRNINLAAIIFFVLNVVFRYLNQLSHWPDQIFVQNFGLSSLLSGVNIYSSNNLAGQSFSYYLPMGSLFGSLPIYFGFENYWDFYHVLVPLLFMIPYIHNQSMTNIAVFIVTAFFFPLVDYTTGGGNVELSYAFLLPGIYLLIHNKNVLCALTLLSFGIMLRQPSIFLIPFVFLVLFRDYSKYYVAAFLGLLFMAGGWYIIRDFDGFLQSNFRSSTSFQEIWYIRNGGLKTNFSISTLLQYFGIKDAWHLNSNIYLLFTLLVDFALIVYTCVAYFKYKIDRKAVLSLGILASLFVYVLARGFTMLHYVMSCAFVFLAFYCTASESLVQPSLQFRKNNVLPVLLTRLVSVVVFLIILCPFLLSVFYSKNHNSSGQLKFSTYFIKPNSSSSEEINVSLDRVGNQLPVGGSIILKLDKTLYVSDLELDGEMFQPTKIEGIDVGNYPSGDKVTGFIRRGVLMGSNDGVEYSKISNIDNLINYHVFPIKLNVNATVQYLKIVVNEAYDGAKSISIGNILIFGQ